MKSLYVTCVIRYEYRDQGDTKIVKDFSLGKSYIMYTHVFVKKYPIPQSKTTRSVPNELKREEVIKGDSDDEKILPRKRQSGGPSKTYVNYIEI